MTETTTPDPLLAGVRLSDMEGRTYSFGEIAEEIGGEGDTLRSWFLHGGLALMPPLDEVAEKGGRSHRLHWRSVALLLLALKLNDLGFAKKTGEAALVAGGAFKAGLKLEHFETTDSPLIAVQREADGTPRVFLVSRDAMAGQIEGPTIRDGFEGIGATLLDPIGFGRIIWRMGWRQVMAETVAARLATFSDEEIEAAALFAAREIAAIEPFVLPEGGRIVPKPTTEEGDA